ncbi:inverse autotransporter beta domain-containing protein [Xenorhabdus eapokensis]|uniref:Putative Bacterial Ig-like domain n=1 Tax=Xenorhabdus eapokensis TaxID=1873482 RepID=A0A1Q5TZK7_9GAMM|nr:inverse autotransporter beta domain-containing protein [Xenorhabdus eapokensis]OKP05653.1 putative Bacterial Ig-like domain [Xenorhabdus eapokensis]
MFSYVRKIIVFYTLFMIISMSNASEVHNINPEKPNAHLKQTHNTAETDISHIIAGHIQTFGNVLSSPSNLAEQAKSYALGKFNSTLSSETQKWLSQFGTARINLGLDRRWTLKDYSLDILLPLYDNKTDWLFFSQLGYRNKDSRNTINLGLGGRYFYQNWMYGLNTFYDHDFTGKNQRLGLGGEIWGDYIKLSANTYYRLSDWQKSRNFQDYYERPANGYDINGEFFLPAYPNLGMKLTYEQYLGDNVTLFNRDTKQKNPILAKLGLTYTPIPLFTMGVDYKQGKSGHTETQFLANLNYKFGVPFSTQLSPVNVASMRTLVGSRYDLVERNNHIILDHLKKEQEVLIALEPIVGYGQQEIPVNAPIQSDADIKHIRWIVTDKAFTNNHGKLSSDSGKSIVITLPSYQETHKSDYKLDILITYNQGGTKVIQVPIKILPFLIDGKINIIPPEYPATTGHEENGYTFSDPIITYQGLPAGKFVKNAKIDKVTWTTEPALGDESGLSFKWNDKPAQTNEKGELTNKEGQLVPNILVSKKIHQEVVVYIQLDGAPRQKIGKVTFSDYKIKGNALNVMPDPKKPLISDGVQKFTYTAEITFSNNLPVGEVNINHVKWNAVGKDSMGNEMKDIFVDGPTGTVKTNQGKLEATLSSKIQLTDVVVTLSIENKESASAKAVSFVADPKRFYVSQIAIDKPGPLIANGENTYTYTAYIVDQDGKAVPEGQEISSIRWSLDDKNKDNKNLEFKAKGNTAGKGGTLTATLGSIDVVKDVVVSLAVEGQKTPKEAKAVSFVADPKRFYVSQIAIDKPGPLIANGENAYTYTAYIVDQDGKAVLEGQEISSIRWSLDDKNKGNKNLEFKAKGNTAEKGGTLTATLDSIDAVKDVVVSLAVEGQETPKEAKAVSFIPDIQDLDINISISPTGSLMANNSDTYTYTATITNKKTNSNVSNYTFDSVEWAVPENIADMTVTKDSDVTDIQGNLVARVKSDVGIDDFSVTLTLNKKISKTSDKRTFNPVPKKAEIFLYNNQNPSVNSDNENIIFSNSPAPVNAFSSLSGVLRNSNGEKITKSNNHSVIFSSTNPDITSIDADTGEISFYKPGNATLSAKITNKSSGIKELYIYTTKVKRYFEQDPNNMGLQWNGRKNCEDSGLVTPNLKADIFNNNDATVLSTEFPDISIWNLLLTSDDINSPTGSHTTFFLVLDDDNNYLIYNSLDHSTNPVRLGGGYLLCVVK